MQKKKYRRTVIKGLLIGVSGIPLITNCGFNRDDADEDVREIPVRPVGNNDATEPISAITLGAGSRGNVYGNYGVQYPNELNIVGVAEPIPIRNERYAVTYDIPEDHRFVTWEHVFERPKFADAVIITTPDDLH